MMFWSTVSRLVPLVLLLAACVVVRAQSSPAEEPPALESNPRNNPASDQSPAPPYDISAHAKQYLRTTFGTSAISLAVASAGLGSALHGTTGWGSGRYVDQVTTDLVRHTTAQSIEFGAAALLQQDQSFPRSREHGFRRRARAAWYHSFFVPGRDGDELAFPRLAAALGTPWAMREFHPGREAASNLWVQSAVLLGCYVARSYWAEFHPEITRTVHKILRFTNLTPKLDSQPPSE